VFHVPAREGATSYSLGIFTDKGKKTARELYGEEKDEMDTPKSSRNWLSTSLGETLRHLREKGGRAFPENALKLMA